MQKLFTCLLFPLVGQWLLFYSFGLKDLERFRSLHQSLVWLMMCWACIACSCFPWDGIGIWQQVAPPRRIGKQYVICVCVRSVEKMFSNSLKKGRVVSVIQTLPAFLAERILVLIYCLWFCLIRTFCMSRSHNPRFLNFNRLRWEWCEVGILEFVCCLKFVNLRINENEPRAKINWWDVVLAKTHIVEGSSPSCVKDPMVSIGKVKHILTFFQCYLWSVLSMGQTNTEFSELGPICDHRANRQPLSAAYGYIWLGEYSLLQQRSGLIPCLHKWPLQTGPSNKPARKCPTALPTIRSNWQPLYQTMKCGPTHVDSLWNVGF